MAKRHTIELLTEANKNISNLINKMESQDLESSVVIDNVNDVIRELDKIVESMERNS